MTSNWLKPLDSGLQASQMDYILVDGSGSMVTNWSELMGGLDAFMDVLKSQHLHSHGILSVFEGSTIGDIQRNSVISEWPRFSHVSVKTSWGGTPLYDAINAMCRHLAELEPPRCSIVIVTDGEDMNSRHTTPDEARALLDWCRAQGWQVTFIGCDFNNTRQAKLLGANESNSIGVQRALLRDAGKLLGKKRMHNAVTDEDINFSEDERSTFGGYLAGPSGN